MCSGRSDQEEGSTCDTKAARQLKLAEAYLKIGLKDKTAGILKKIVADFPNTGATEAVVNKLHELPRKS